MTKSRLLRKSRKNRRRRTIKRGGGIFDSFTNLFKSNTNPPLPSNPTINPINNIEPVNQGGKTRRSRSSRKM